MTDRTLNPIIVKEMLGEHTLVGASKMVFCEHERQTVFGGVAKPNMSEYKDKWHMAVGTLIFVPLKVLVWNHVTEDWSLEDLVVSGMDKDYWEEI